MIAPCTIIHDATLKVSGYNRDSETAASPEDRVLTNATLTSITLFSIFLP